MVEDILWNHEEVVPLGNCNGVIGGVSLLLDALWVFFKDWPPIFRASSQLQGHLERHIAFHEGNWGYRVRQFL